MIRELIDLLRNGVIIHIDATIRVGEGSQRAGRYPAQCPHCEWEGNYTNRSNAARALRDHIQRVHEIIEDQDHKDTDWIVSMDDQD